MNKDEIIKALRDMAKYPTVTLPRDCEALKAAADLLAQPEPWEEFCDSNCVWTDHHPDCKLAKRTWVHLTNEEHTELAIECGCLGADWVFYGAVVERKVREKNS